MQLPKGIKMFVTDYDGTLAHSNGYTSEYSKEILRKLGEKGVIRVVATGRNLFSCKQVMDSDFPIDYLVFSSGIGVINWKTGKLLFENHLMPHDVNTIEAYLINHSYDFMLQYPLPNNHIFYVHASGRDNDDFYSRIKLYRNYGLQLPAERPQMATQFIVICKHNNGQYEKVKAECVNYKVIRATSPLDNKSLWIEIFPKQVSKASGIKFLCEKLNIHKKQVVVCGNDYNDFDMLNWAQYSYVVENAVAELKDKFQIIALNNNDGVAKFAESLFPNN